MYFSGTSRKKVSLIFKQVVSRHQNSNNCTLNSYNFGYLLNEQVDYTLIQPEEKNQKLFVWAP